MAATHYPQDPIWRDKGYSAQRQTLTCDSLSVAGVFREREEDDYCREQIVDRWQNAGRSILSSVRMVRNAETLGDKFASGAERYGACKTPHGPAV